MHRLATSSPRTVVAGVLALQYQLVNISLYNSRARSALEPYISGEIMELHHSRHHATYVNGLNTALEKYEAVSIGHAALFEI